MRMVKYLVATHGDLAKGFVETLGMIAGDGYDVSTYCMPKDKSGDDVERELRERMSDWREHRYVVFTDLMGGSVNNTLTTMLLGGMEFELVTGTNLALLIGVVMSAEDDPGAAIREAMDEARGGIVHINEILRERRQGA